MKAFLSTDVALTNAQIMSYYSKRWSIETYFRTAKVHLGRDRYQVRSTKAIDRYWALLLFVSLCCTYGDMDEALSMGFIHIADSRGNIGLNMLINKPKLV
ncbi:transposase [Paenibacillus taiwanensis]|uniref:transposase n=1 Tax=Paenibacillus taiwanensis TaxID=401638 RepID=UPI00048B5A3C|nr:transposase [Paenibacillus taiwanensis]